ncbi:MAG: YihA family ribosome biogenesis GTP-binding protein [Ruminiclostridium sp.]|nr:YihA family ribosome biogenesis GTP-binding protein [Ruminiclostridium sp.]
MNYNKAEFTASYGLFRQIPASDRPEFAFSGHSNVGKSSLINKLLNRKSLARVSATPGKTSTINFFSVDGIYIVDLPGYGYAKVSQNEKKRWAELIEGYLHDDRDLALVFQLIDFRHKPTADDVMMIDFLIDSGIPFVVVLTKADKLKKKEREERREAFRTEIPCADDITMIEFSAETGEGVEELRAIIEDAIGEENEDV